MTTRPSLAKRTSSCRMACVPMTRSISPGGDLFQHGRSLLGRQPAGQFRAADLAAGQESPDREGMLPGKDFRGGHEHGLMSVGHCQAAWHTRRRRSCRFPRRPARGGSWAATGPCRPRYRRLPGVGPASARKGRGGGFARRSGPWPQAAGPAATRAADAALTARASPSRKSSW